jgi:hypothetical protein
MEARETGRQLTQDLGRTPADPEMARHLAVSAADLRDARRAEIASRPSSLDAPLVGQPATATLADVLGEEDRRLEHMLNMRAVAAHWGELPPYLLGCARASRVRAREVRRCRHGSSPPAAPMAWGVLPPAPLVRGPLMGTCGLIADS